MKILHINCNYIGTALHQTMIEHLNHCDLENQVYAPTYDRSRAVIKPNQNVLVSECFRKWDRLIFDYKQAKIQKDLESKIDVSAFDCIHAYTLFTDGNCAKKLSEKYHVPYVVAVRNTDVNTFFAHNPFLRRRGVEIMKGASAVFFLSNAYKKAVFAKYVPAEDAQEINAKVQIIPNGIDDFWFQNIQQESILPKAQGNKIRLIYAGGIDKNKNITTTQKAIYLLREQGYDVTLTVVGKTVDRKVYENISKDPYTTCFPAQPKEKLISYYRSSDIFVMPSFHESFGLVYAEAMSQGLPVIYTRGQGFDEQFEDGAVGYAVNASSAEEIADIIKRIWEDYERIRENCLNSFQKFHWDKIVALYFDIYKRYGV